MNLMTPIYLRIDLVRIPGEHSGKGYLPLISAVFLSEDCTGVGIKTKAYITDV